MKEITQINSIHWKGIRNVLFLCDWWDCMCVSDSDPSFGGCHHFHGCQYREEEGEDPSVCFCRPSQPAESRELSRWRCWSWWRRREGASCALIFARWPTPRASRRLPPSRLKLKINGLRGRSWLKHRYLTWLCNLVSVDTPEILSRDILYVCITATSGGYRGRHLRLLCPLHSILHPVLFVRGLGGLVRPSVIFAVRDLHRSGIAGYVERYRVGEGWEGVVVHLKSSFIIKPEKTLIWQWLTSFGT